MSRTWSAGPVFERSSASSIARFSCHSRPDPISRFRTRLRSVWLDARSWTTTACDPGITAVISSRSSRVSITLGSTRVRDPAAAQFFQTSRRFCNARFLLSGSSPGRGYVSASESRSIRVCATLRRSSSVLNSSATVVLPTPTGPLTTIKQTDTSFKSLASDVHRGEDRKTRGPCKMNRPGKPAETPQSSDRAHPSRAHP